LGNNYDTRVQKKWNDGKRDSKCPQLHFNICKEIGVKLDKEQWYYVHVPELVETRKEGKVTISWNQQLQTNRTIPNNKTRHYNS
jgi:hypothetical protein